MITGYADRFSATAGDRIAFMLDGPDVDCEIEIIRLIHGDTNPEGPGQRELPVPGIPVRRARVTRQEVHPGAHVRCANFPGHLLRAGFTLSAWVWPAGPTGSVQGVIGAVDSNADACFALVLDEEGRPALRVGDTVHSAETPLPAHRWSRLTAGYDPTTGEILIEVGEGMKARHEAGGPGSNPPARPSEILLGAGRLRRDAQHRLYAYECFNGKIESPVVFAGPLPRGRGSSGRRATRRELIAEWRLGPVSAPCVQDLGPHGVHGVPVNAPVTAVTGHTWTGEIEDFRQAPDQYAAMEFHEDAVGDAAWTATVEVELPDTLESGVYAAKVSGGGEEDRVPFFVRQPAGEPAAPVAVLMPTLTYLAYANDRLGEGLPTEAVPTETSRQLDQHPEFGMSLYDHHSDGQGSCLSSRLRPILTMRPQFRFQLTGDPVHFSADLYLIDWLYESGIQHDVLTDEDLHHQSAALSGYRVLITGSHPEYWTARMREALEAFLAEGGRVMYLGGNGFYWVTGIDPYRPHLIEIRRGTSGTRTWESRPGEIHLASTGEFGGLWRHRGKSPARLVGVTSTAQGWDTPSSGYLRTSASREPRADFIFDGVNDDLIGDFGLVIGGGAAGHETDRADPEQGTPSHALVVATSQKLNRSYLLMAEDVPVTTVNVDGETNPKVRADMVFFETPAGGAVFSVGSINWLGSLSHNDYTNNVSRITRNVLDRFLDETKFAIPS